MKYTRILFIGILAALSSAVFAGLAQPAPITITIDPVDNSGSAQGDMVTARFSDNDVENIGCGIRVIENESGGFQFGFCQATDSEETQAFCTTQNANLLEAMKAVSAYSFITFSFDADGECTRIGFSSQALYIPNKVHKVSKNKKK